MENLVRLDEVPHGA